MDKLLLTELAGILKVKKVDSVRLWCLERKIQVFGRRGHRWVLAMDVAIEMDRDLIAHLIERYGKEHWFSVYKIYLDNDTERLIGLKFASALDQKNRKFSGYTPKSEISAKFLNNLP